MKKTLIELAKEAGFFRFKGELTWHCGDEELMKFAELLQANSGNAVDERAAFEEWAVKQRDANDLPYFIVKSGNGFYADGLTNHAWNGWKARASVVNKPDYHVISDSGDGLVAMSSAVAGQLLYMRDMFLKQDYNEAYTALISLADPNLSHVNIWQSLEAITKG